MENSDRTTLWDVIFSIQARLERSGLDPQAVDFAIVRGVESLLARRRPRAC